MSEEKQTKVRIIKEDRPSRGIIKCYNKINARDAFTSGQVTNTGGVDMKSIPLTQGKFAIVDEDNFDILSKYKWHYDNHTGYARASVNGKWCFLHRFVMNAQKGQIIDHVDCVKLNCQKINLRFCTRSQNESNKKTPPSNTSGYRGVSWNKEKQKYDAQIKIGGKHKHLGRFNKSIDAAREYNKAAVTYFGDFARLNDI